MEKIKYSNFKTCEKIKYSNFNNHENSKLCIKYLNFYTGFGNQKYVSIYSKDSFLLILFTFNIYIYS